MATITIGVDLAKRVFATCEADSGGRVVRRLELCREGFSAWLAQQFPGTVIAMGACTGDDRISERWLASISGLQLTAEGRA